MNQHQRIDKLVGDHALRLSERLQAHRAQLFPPDAQRSLRKFTSGEVADLLGVKDAYLRKLHLDGKGPSPEIRTGGRRYYTPENIQEMRVFLEQGAKMPGTYLPGRRPGDHLQVITVINFKGGSGKTTTAAHLAQKMALDGYRVLAIDLDPQAVFRRCTGSSRNSTCWMAAHSMTRSAMTIRCRSETSSTRPISPISTSFRAIST